MTDDLDPAVPGLGALFQDDTEELTIFGNEPIRLDCASTVWLITDGAVEIFAVETDEEKKGSRTHIVTIEAGQMLFGVDSRKPRSPFGAALKREKQETILLAVGLPETRLREVDAAAFTQLAQKEEHVGALTAAIEQWVKALFSKVPRKAAPRIFKELKPGIEVRFDEAQGVTRTAGGVVWVRHVEGGSHFLGRAELEIGPSDILVPVSEETWLTSAAPTTLSCVATGHLLKSGNVWEGLGRFHELFLRYVDLQLASESQEDRRRLTRKLELDRATLEASRVRLASVLAVAPARRIDFGESSDPLFAACRMVGESQGLHLVPPPSAHRAADPRHRLNQICVGSRIRYRQVILREDWWRHDNGPLLGFLSEKPAGDGGEPIRRHPVALLPTSPTSYELADPDEPSRTPIDERVNERLEGGAFMFYPPLPERPVVMWDLVRLAFRGRRSEVATALLMGLAGGLLALLVPLVTGQVFGHIIPSADRRQLLQMILALVVAALAGAAFQVTRAMTVLRLTGKIDGTLQTAIWDRLLSLPITFYRRYTVGDLAIRSLGIDAIRNLLLGNAVTALLAAVFSLTSVSLLFFYSWRLALVACALIALLFCVTGVLSYLQLQPQRELFHTQGKVASLLFGLIRGIAKLRTGGAEPQAYALWAERFTEQREQTLKAQKLANLQAAFAAAYPTLASLSLFAMVGLASQIELSVSRFLAFSAAFGQFQAAMLTLLPLISSLLAAVPIYERLTPLLQAAPEVDEVKADVGELSGDVEFSHVSFRYEEDGPLILNDVSFRAGPGELIALVGPSGSGKSTCIRLLLGFEQPSAGSLYFDGQSLSSLNVQSVRRQIGVVLQDGKPMPGDIFRNIIGTSNLGLKEAQEAARMAGLEEDIAAMPMGMHTVISESAGTFSGGQLQRLLIARAVVRRPRLLLLDEATSALDNRTQEIVSQSLERLKATRIVVAHRLSTIRKADRIFVLDQGRVVEVGTYEELIAVGGVFARLAARQLT